MVAKYRMYIDESGNSDVGPTVHDNNRFLCLTGVIIDLSYVNEKLSPDLENFKNKYFGNNADEPVILHRKDIMNYRGRFSVLKNVKLQNAYECELFKKLKQWHYVIISVLLDKAEIVDIYGSFARHPYYFCLEVLLEKYCMFLRDLGAVGDMLIESRGKYEDRELSNVYRSMYENGTRYLSSADLSKYLTSKEIKIRPKSANIAGLQIADILVTNIRNYILENYELKDKTDSSFAVKLLDSISSKIYNHHHKYWGYGLKKLP